MEFIYPNKSAFEQEFGAYDTSAFGTGSTWDKLVSMTYYNKFGVTAADLNYNAHFSCIKGARILWLDGKAFGKLQ